MHPGGSATKGTQNAVGFFEQDYLELLCFTTKDEYLRMNPGGGLADFVEGGGGLRFVVLQAEDLEETVKVCETREWK